MMLVEDAREDDRFSANRLVTGDTGSVFYAGVPLVVRGDLASPQRSAAIGTLCVIHDEPCALDPGQQAALQDLARLAEMLVERTIFAMQSLRLAEERRADLRAIDLRNRHFRQAERMANIGSWRLSLGDNRVQWSDQVYAIHGLPVGEEPPLETALDFYPRDARTIVSNALASAVATGQPFDVENDFVTKQGKRRRVRSIGEIELNEEPPIAVIGVFQNITAQHALEGQLRRSAQYDDLTGLPNQAYLNLFFDRKLSQATQEGETIVVMIMDLDGFKAVNDKCGHGVGDAKRRFRRSPVV